VEEIDGACGMHKRTEFLSTALVGIPERKDHLEDIDIDQNIILKCMLNEYDGGTGLN
jgi:hypothetical protein